MKRGWLALFLVLGAGCVSKTKYNDLQAQYEQQVQTSQKQAERIKELEKQIDRWQAQAKARVESYQEIMREFKPLIDKGILEIKVEDGNVLIGMAADVLFPSGSATLSPAGKENLAEVGKLLARHQNREFQVQGHTDNDPIKSKEFANNWYLGSARAIVVTEFLIANGMAKTQVSAASFADARPVAPNDSPENKGFNRRIEIILVPDLSDLPGYEDLLKADDEGGKDRKRPPKRGRKK